MAVVGAQLSHAFILAPFAMSSSDLRFFRLASGHSADRHDRVVRATKGALRFDDLSPTTVVNQECDNDQSRKSSSQPHSENCSDTFCNLVHPGQHDCMHAALPSFQRALKMACLLYTPFLALQIVRALAVCRTSHHLAAIAASVRLRTFLISVLGLHRVCACVSVCLCLCLCLCLRVCGCVCVAVWLCLCGCGCVCVAVAVSASVPVSVCMTQGWQADQDTCERRCHFLRSTCVFLDNLFWLGPVAAMFICSNCPEVRAGSATCIDLACGANM